MAKLSSTVSVETTRINLGADEIVEQAKRLSGSYVKVGAQAGSGRHDASDIDLARLLAVHEFGEPELNIPERSTLRYVMNTHQYKYLSHARMLLQRMQRREISANTLMTLMGEIITTDVQKMFGSHLLEANAPATVARKGSSAPLIDTGQLRQAIRYVVVMASKGMK